MEDLRPLIGKGFEHATPIVELRISTLPRLSNLGDHPISRDLAAGLCDPLVGVASDRTFANWRREWWDQLRSASSAEEKLSCERMIDAINIAFGLHQAPRGLDLAESNRASVKHAEEQAAKAREAQAIARWR